MIANAVREYIRGRVIVDRGVQVGAPTEVEEGRRRWELPLLDEGKPCELYGPFTSVVDLVEDPREQTRIACHVDGQ